MIHLTTGGNIMGHACTYRIFLRKVGRDRLAIMVDSTHHAYGQVKFTINERGWKYCSKGAGEWG